MCVTALQMKRQLSRTVGITDELQMITVKTNSSVTLTESSNTKGLDGAKNHVVTDVTVTSYSFNSRTYKNMYYIYSNIIK